MQASFKASTGRMPSHTSDFDTWNKSLLNKLQDYIKSLPCDGELKRYGKTKYSFSGNEKLLQKSGSHFYGHVMTIYNLNQNHMPDKMALNFL